MTLQVIVLHMIICAHDFTGDSFTHGYCGFIRGAHHMWQAYKCSDNAYGYICEHEGIRMNCHFIIFCLSLFIDYLWIN